MVERAVTFFFDYEGEEMDETEFREVNAAVEEGLQQAERGDGISLA